MHFIINDPIFLKLDIFSSHPKYQEPDEVEKFEKCKSMYSPCHRAWNLEVFIVCVHSSMTDARRPRVVSPWPAGSGTRPAPPGRSTPSQQLTFHEPAQR